MIELALGTAQFGLSYGVAGRGHVVPEDEVRAILRRARQLGVRVLDTAAAYGDIETRLAGLAGDAPFSVVSKLPALGGACAADTDDFVKAAIQRTRAKLGSLLSAILFHRAEDLLGVHGGAAWQACDVDGANRDLRFGVSCYDAETLDRICERVPISIAQLPGSALDQRLHGEPSPSRAKVEIHLRSVFLQGLLLLPEEKATARVPSSSPSIARFHSWCRERGLPWLDAALGLAKGLPGVRVCVVGVDSQAHLEAIAAAWETVPALHAPALATADLDVIDPRRWSTIS